VEEVKGIAEVAEVDWRAVLLANFAYEMSTVPMCTSIVARNKDNYIIHGRNLDFPFWGYFSKLSCKVDFYEGNKYIATINAMAGSVFAVTGIKPGVLSASIDTRHEATMTQFDQVWENLF